MNKLQSFAVKHFLDRILVYRLKLADLLGKCFTSFISALFEHGRTATTTANTVC